MQEAEGYVATMVAGKVTFEHGQPTGALPGGLVRNPLRHSLPNVTKVSPGQPSAEIVDVATVAHPHSTNDTLIDTAALTGGASAIAAAARRNMKAAESVHRLVTCSAAGCSTQWACPIRGSRLQRRRSIAF